MCRVSSWPNSVICSFDTPARQSGVPAEPWLTLAGHTGCGGQICVQVAAPLPAVSGQTQTAT